MSEVQNESNHIDVYRKLFAVMSELGWVEKDGTVSMGGRNGYAYATEASFIAAVRPLMIKHGLVMIPHVTDSSVQPVIAGDKVTYAAAINVVYRFLDIDSGSYVDVAMVGTGNDSGDKGIYKALTGAYKYTLRQVFMIGTGDDPEGSSEDDSAPSPSPITIAVKHYNDTLGEKFSKEMINSIKEAGFVWSDGHGIDEQKTAKKIREITKKMKSGTTFEDALK